MKAKKYRTAQASLVERRLDSLEIKMTLDECLETVNEKVADEIERLIEIAGTSDADWQILKAAGEEIAKLKAKVREL
jgi:hypothetical protein